MSYPFDCFKTIENISLEKLKKNPDIDSIFLSSKEESILNEYKLEIEDYKKKKEINTFSFEILKKLSGDFDRNKKEYIERFFKELILFKNTINTNNQNIKDFIFILKKLNGVKLNVYNKNLLINNPINSKIIDFGFLKKDYFNYINTYNDSDKEKLKKNIDILLLGDIINLSLPSIGPINNYLSSNKYNYIEFINELISYKKNTDEIIKIPLVGLYIGDVLSEKLLNLNINKIGNNLNYNFNNENMKNLIISMVKHIDIKLIDIFYIYGKNNKTPKKIKYDFIIPYKIEKYPSKPEEIVKMTKSDIDKNNNFEKVIQSNNKVVSYVINNIFKKPKDEGIKNLEKKNYKNVLACYLFYIINLIYTIVKLYIDKLDEILKNIVDSREKRFSILNIKDAFEYTSLLNKSLLNFNKVLLNNYYYLFIPSKIVSGNYGMKIDEYNCYIPESIFLGDNETILKEYPFNDGVYDELLNDNNEIKFDTIKMTNFITTFKGKNDIYKSTLKLEFGGLMIDNTTLKKTLDILSEYYKILEKNNIFSIFVIDKLIDNFKNKDCIPFEFIEEYYNLVKINPSANKDIEKKILNKFDIQIKKSTEYFFRLTDIRNKIKKIKKTDIHNLHILEEILQLNFIAYRTKALSLITICEKLITDTKLKNSLLKMFYQKKEENIKLIQEYLQNK
jgi:hypothetical protein